MEKIENVLSIFIITYNRSFELKRTLSELCDSQFSNCKITVLDNNSSDNTHSVFDEFFSEYINFHYRKNVTNIGLSANATQSFLLSKSKYTWILCDDDIYSFEKSGDVLKALLTVQPVIALVGGHREPIRASAGQTASAKVLMAACPQLNYYRDISFLPSAIYLTDFALNNIAKCYDFSFFCYPHMALAFKAVEDNLPIYTSESYLVTPTYGTQSYTRVAQLKWWYGLSKTIKDPIESKRFLTSQWVGPLDPSGLYGLLNTTIRLKQYGIFFGLIVKFNYRVIHSIVVMMGNRVRRLIGGRC
jgi:glycosyltransferase involved in cell wall biosynthesis